MDYVPGAGYTFRSGFANPTRYNHRGRGKHRPSFRMGADAPDVMHYNEGLPVTNQQGRSAPSSAVQGFGREPFRS
jgi:hypothetical protein